MWLYAQLSENAYLKRGRRDSPDSTRLAGERGFILPDTAHAAEWVEDRKTGFAATVYVVGDSARPARVIIAFRGTENPLFVSPDWKYGNWGSRQQRQAIAFYDNIRAKYDSANASLPAPAMALTGHSLGGALAIQVSAVRDSGNLPAFVFNTSYRKIILRKTDPDTVTNRRVSLSHSGEVAKLVRFMLPNPTILHIPGYRCKGPGGASCHTAWDAKVRLVPDAPGGRRHRNDDAVPRPAGAGKHCTECPHMHAPTRRRVLIRGVTGRSRLATYSAWLVT